MLKGKFIVIEGLEGAGKSNAQQIVIDSLQKHNIQFITTREPGGTPIAEALRRIWKEGVEGEYTTDKAELLMLYASRTQLVETIIQPALDNGIWVVGDRHNMSTLAYQGGGRGLSEPLLNTIKNAILGEFEPDLTLYLDLDPKIGLERAKGRGELDRIEQQHIDFFYRTRKRYLELVEQNSKAIKINAEQCLEKVSEEIRTVVEKWLI
ncbi:dTMP kinase [Pasteurella atlantica]|uniref:dTMP kinase n=2 Tax=Pasteurellaceae TaxID=712 RepID=A0ACC6HPK9_9PAST|nr:dTMP kinase [Pasteurella atlantica]MDP8034094.1 dTMP kinase [Pasteurella atlantica]MDP8036000.1 dTMP kinase [Pasteurella atlantica]MDP8037950.1 dTMP kinase [Pasteurella atlantica]MDP8048332.1 dTMP kinase [Pasteurella atlantica]MDP8050262.1 dTMP kinase [Pasteurella atlantica]